MKRYILIGIVIIISSFLLSLYFSDKGCGVCPGYVNYNPTLMISGLPNVYVRTPEFCRWVGCQPLQVPIFIDLYLVGIAFVGFGIFKSVMSNQRSTM